MPLYRIWAIDCDGPGDIRYAPTFDNEAEAQAWIDKFVESDPGDITRIWIEEEEDDE